MGYGAPLSSSTRYSSGGFAGIAAGMGKLITSSASANTKGAWTSIFTAASDLDGFFVYMAGISGFGVLGYRGLVDIGINTGSATQVLAANLRWEPVNGSAIESEARCWLPVRVPSGATLYARMQDATGSGQISLCIEAYQGDARSLPGFRGLDCCTDLTNSDPTTTFALVSSGATSWKQVQASTVHRISGLLLATTQLTTASGGACRCMIQVGWGAGGSEQELFRTQGGFFVLGQGPGFYWLYPCDLPAGTRLAVKVTQYDSLTQTVGVFLYGLVT